MVRVTIAETILCNDQTNASSSQSNTSSSHKTKNHKIKGQTFIRHGLHPFYTQKGLFVTENIFCKEKMAKTLIQNILYTPRATSIN